MTGRLLASLNDQQLSCLNRGREVQRQPGYFMDRKQMERTGLETTYLVFIASVEGQGTSPGREAALPERATARAGLPAGGSRGSSLGTGQELAALLRHLLGVPRPVSTVLCAHPGFTSHTFRTASVVSRF